MFIDLHYVVNAFKIHNEFVQGYEFDRDTETILSIHGNDYKEFLTVWSRFEHLFRKCVQTFLTRKLGHPEKFAKNANNNYKNNNFRCGQSISNILTTNILFDSKLYALAHFLIFFGNFKKHVIHVMFHIEKKETFNNPHPCIIIPALFVQIHFILFSFLEK